MRVVVTGGTGFIGRSLVAALLADGMEVAVPSRSPARAGALFGGAVVCAEWDGRDPEPLARLLSCGGRTAVVNLAGENIAGKRWTLQRKADILDSRIFAGQAVAEAARLADAPPEVLIQGSAVGYYGPRPSCSGRVLDEDRPAGAGFLADVCRGWEASSAPVEGLGVRRVVVRTGLVLGRGGGILEKFLPPFRFFVGGALGDGSQWLPWVHMDDVVGAVRWLLATGEARGAYNLCAPVAVTMSEFCRELGHALGRPSWLPVPAFVLSLLLGSEMARETVLANQRAAPVRLMQEGYSFVRPGLADALAASLGTASLPPGGRSKPE